MLPDPHLPPSDAVSALLAGLDTAASPQRLQEWLVTAQLVLGACQAVLARRRVDESPGPPPAVTAAAAFAVPASTPTVQRPPTPDEGALLCVQMLDGLRIWSGPTPLHDLPHGKARAVLMHLLLHRQRPVSRQRLCALFWPDAEPTAARNNLNVTLHRLRRLLPGAATLRHADEGYRIAPPGGLWLDVEEFERHASQGEQAERLGDALAARAAYEIAAAVYRADLVEESEREPVLQARSQCLRDQFNLVLERLTVLCEAQGDIHGSLRAAQRHLALDECNEGAHQRLMRGYARLGQPQLAEAQYRTCERALARRLGLAPAEETRALMRRIGARAL